MITPGELKRKYAEKRPHIEKRLGEFCTVGKKGKAALLSELVFCICAANSSAAAAWRAQTELEGKGLLFADDDAAIARVLLRSHVRFHNNKAKYIIEARKKLIDNGELAKRLGKNGPQALRLFLVREGKGLGYKEAGHYLRNIGHGEDLAILDRHIFKNLKSLGVLDAKPKSLTPKKYIEVEAKMREFSRREGIPLSHLDLLFWSEETGRIFK